MKGKPIRWLGLPLSIAAAGCRLIGMRSAASALASTANFVGWSGAYNSTDLRRKHLDAWRVQMATANMALGQNLQTLVDQSRQLERTSPIARGVVEGLKADIIGTGIDVEPDTGDEALNKRIRDEWLLWTECAGVDGTPLWEIQSMAASEWAVAGAIIHRYLILPERLQAGHLPLAILPLEPEWLSALPIEPVPLGHSFVRGKVIDRLGRVVAYDLQDPNQLASGWSMGGERVPAYEICHGYEKRRAFQAQGEPVLAPVIERIKQTDDIVAIELQAAKATAAPAVAITSDADPAGTTTTGESVTDIPAGATVRLLPGEGVSTIENKRPSQLIAPFMGAMIGSVAAACRVARKWLTKAYDGATYMNTRLEQLDSARQQRPVQQWMGRHIASSPYERLLPWILMRLGVEMPADPVERRNLFKHKLMPDVPEYVDPLKDGEAAVQNIQSNLSTLQDECGKRGKDWRKVLAQRAEELKEMKRLNLTPAAPKTLQINPYQQQEETDGATADVSGKDQNV